MNKKKRAGSLLLAAVILLSVVFSLISEKQVCAATKDTYVIKVNKKMNTVTVYRNDIPIKAMVCSVGKTGNTPEGTFQTSQKLRWHTLFGPKEETYVYGQYCTRFNGHFLFHSVCYDKNKEPDTLNVTEYRKLGTAASKGCIRLTVEDAKWLYDNCPLNTRVVVYNSSTSGPLGKPSVPVIPKTNKSGWDPTDPDPENPYEKSRPTIAISKNKKSTVYVGTTFDPIDGVTAKSYKGKSLTSKIEVIGKVDTKKEGTYLLTYRVQDSVGNYCSREFEVTVKLRNAPYFSGYQENVTLKLSGDTVKKTVKAKDRDGTDITASMKISFSSDYIKKSENTLSFTRPGVYTITYKVTGLKKNGAVTTTKKMKVTVLDNRKPTITDKIRSETITVGTEYGKTEILKGLTAKTKWKSYTKKITYTVNGRKQEAVDTSKPGNVRIRYLVKSDGGKTATGITRKLIIKEQSE